MDQICLPKSCLADISFTSTACDRGSNASKAARHGKSSYDSFLFSPNINLLFCSRQSVLDNPSPNQQRQPQAPRPQPQAGPRPNLFGFHQAGAQQQPENDALARVLGIFARNAAQPQVPPPQHPPAQGPQNVGTQGWAPGPAPGVVIQYNIQYQGQPPHGQVQVSRPVPPFSGFVGPNQDWRPWDFDQRWRNQRGAAAAQEHSGSEGGNSTRLQAQNTPQTPNEAAAQAALRRLDGNSTTSAPSSGTAPVASSSNDTSAWKVPTLIPLDSQALEILPATSQQMAPSLPSSPLTVPPGQAPGSFDGSQTSGAQSHDRNSSHATDAQLAILDRNTREAIDERIRILQGVSDTITRCMDDLARVRSALPPPLSMPLESPLGTRTSDTRCMLFRLANVCYQVDWLFQCKEILNQVPPYFLRSKHRPTRNLGNLHRTIFMKVNTLHGIYKTSIASSVWVCVGI